ncbi:MAG: chromosomal replication initiator protein DnaA [Chlamydiales bacterium]|nr:chromosomal replication initiator protein DnaA [Chlamydiales bacterium]
MQAWDQFLAHQEKEYGQETVSRWLRTLKVLRFDACNIYLEAQDSFQVLWFDEHIRSKCASLVNNNQKPIKVHLSMPEHIPTAPRKRKPQGLKGTSPTPEPSFQIFFDELDPSCTLDDFLVSDDNKVAYKLLEELTGRLVDSKVQAMSAFSGQTPASIRDFLNPIFLYGQSGSGKTHLLMAVAQKLRRVGYKAVYARSELFTEHVVKAIRSSEMSHFRNTYRNADVLLIDDVQVFGRKNATQEEFFHTFNTLHTEGKQIILSSNVPPQSLQFIEPRLISRFEWGIVLPLTPPQKKDIAKILEHKAASYQYPVSARTLEFLAESFATNPKSAVKALEALMLRSHLNKSGQKVHLPLNAVKAMLSDLIENEKEKAISSDRIIQAVADHFSLAQEDLVGKSQSRECVIPRQLAMHLCRELLKTPYMQIGDLFQRDHSTVMSAIRQIQKQMSTPGNDLALALSTIQRKLLD